MQRTRSGEAAHDVGGEIESGRVRLIDTLVEAVDQTFDAIIITDAELDAPGPRIVYANPAFCRMTGYSADELVGATPRILHGPATDRSVLDRLRDELAENGSFLGRAINYRRDGTEFTMEWSISTLRGADHEPQFYVAVQRDVTTFQRMLTEAELLANTDSLTGLSNRRRFDFHLAAMLEDPGTSQGVGLITFDIDHFKAVNDSNGHAVGDAILREVARRISDATPAGALVARTGGEEFAVVLHDAPDLASVCALAEDLRAVLRSHPVTVVSDSIEVTASFGIAHVDVSGSDSRALMP